MLTTLPGACFAKPGATGLPFFGVDIAVVVKDDRGDARATRTKAASSSSGGRGRRWRARSGATTSATCKTYWDADPGRVLHGRRRAPRRGRLLLGRRPHRRRAQRRGAPHRHRRDRERARRAIPPSPKPRRSGKPDDLKGQALVVFVTLKSGQSREQGAEGQAHVAHRQGDRKVRAARSRSASPTRSRRRAAGRSCGAS